VVVAAIALTAAGGGNFTVSLLNDIGIAALVALGLVLLTGVGGATSFGQAAFVGIAAYATAWLTTTQGLSPWLGLAVRAGAHRASRPWPSACYRCAWAATSCRSVDDRLGPVDRDAVRQRRRARRAHRAVEHPPLRMAGWSLAEPRAIYYLIWVLVGLRLPVQPEPAAVAAGPRDPQPARRCHAARQRRRRRVPRALTLFVTRRCAPAWRAGSTRT
jgi:branched-chain amino acid transport system permease protein